jgi:hypothetical protein
MFLNQDMSRHATPEKGVPQGVPEKGITSGITDSVICTSPRVCLMLVKIDFAASCLNRLVRQIFDLVDGGSASEAGLLWVFNLANNPSGYRRELRFWCPELKARAAGEPAKYHRQDIGWIVAQILPGSRQMFHAGEVSELLQVRARTRIDYGLQLPGRREGCRNTYCRPALERFLTRRWLGSCVAAINPALARCTGGTRFDMKAATK